MVFGILKNLNIVFDMGAKSRTSPSWLQIYPKTRYVQAVYTNWFSFVFK